jgi:hypothetical protein
LLILPIFATGACAHGQPKAVATVVPVGPGWTKVARRAGDVGSSGAWNCSAPFYVGAGVVRMTGVVTSDDPKVPVEYGIALMRGRRPAADGADQVPIDPMRSPVVTVVNDVHLFDMVSRQRLERGYYCFGMQSGDNTGLKYTVTIYFHR